MCHVQRLQRSRLITSDRHKDIKIWVVFCIVHRSRLFLLKYAQKTLKYELCSMYKDITITYICSSLQDAKHHVPARRQTSRTVCSATCRKRSRVNCRSFYSTHKRVEDGLGCPFWDVHEDAGGGWVLRVQLSQPTQPNATAALLWSAVSATQRR